MGHEAGCDEDATVLTHHVDSSFEAEHEARCDEDAPPKCTYGRLETLHTDVAASNGSSTATVELGQETSDGEDSESDAPYTPELDTVFDALVELAGEDGRDWVPVRQIQAQTSLRLERLQELLKEWGVMGVICRDDTRLEVAFCLSVAAQIEKCSQTCTIQRSPWPWRKVAQVTGVSLSFSVVGTERSCVILNSMAPEQR